MEACYCIGPGTTGTGIDIGGAGSRIIACTTEGLAGGFGVNGNGDDSSIAFCRDIGSTAALSVAAGVTGLSEVCNSFATVSDTVSTPNQPLKRENVQSFASSAATFPAITPVFTLSSTTAYVVDAIGGYAAGAQALTVNAPTNSAHISPNGIVEFVITKTGANALNITWDAVYLAQDGTAFVGLPSVASNTSSTVRFRKVSTNYVCLGVSAQVAV